MLTSWRVKGVVQKVLGGVPGGKQVNARLQRTFGELRQAEKAIDSKVVDDWLVLAAQLRELQVPLEGAHLVEVGTGWFPTFPLCFALAGVRACHTYDLHRHWSEDLTRRTIDRLRIHLPRIAQVSGTQQAEVERRYAEICRAGAAPHRLQRIGIEYHAPADASSTGLAGSSVDVVFSNSVLEHVEAQALQRIFAESRRILKPGGVAIHSVNCGDHYAYFDRTITPINYLQYSEDTWQFWNNDLLYQNRLRPVDFLDIARKEQLEIILSRYTPKPTLLSMLPELHVAPEFSRYAPEELCATSIDFAVRKPAV